MSAGGTAVRHVVGLRLVRGGRTLRGRIRGSGVTGEEKGGGNGSQRKKGDEDGGKLGGEC